MEAEAAESTPGAWEAWKRSLTSFLAAVGKLASIRWEMARLEAATWSKSVVLALSKILLAAALLFFAAGLLAAGLVAVLQSWFGSLIAAIFSVLTIYLVAAGLLVFSAVKGRRPPPRLEQTVAQLEEDFERLAERAE